MAAYPITIPGAYSRPDVMSPSSMASPLSISSPYSVHSSLSNNSIAGQTMASSFATSVNSSSTVASALSPTSEDEGALDSAASLKKHKPHECDVCGACFARKVHLQRHSLRHQVCKPYCCERCGKCFSRQDSLVRHHRLLHEKLKDKSKRAVGTTKKKSNSAASRNNRDSFKPSSLPSSSLFQDSNVDFRAQRRQSVGQMTINSTASSFDEEDEDMMSISEETSAFSPVSSFSGPVLSSFSGSGSGSGGSHGPRRATVSNMETLSYQSEFQCSFPRVYDDSFNPATSQWASQLHQPQSFELPNLDTMNFVDVKSLHPQQLHQHMASAPAHQTFYDASTPSVTTSSASENEAPLLSLYQQASSSDQAANSTSPSFDWSSMIHGSITSSDHNMAGDGHTPALPFSKSALDKSLNFTLSRGPEGGDNSCLPSPSIHATHKQFPSVEQQQQQQQSPLSSAPPATGGTVNLASLGLPVPPNLNISLPADLQMSAENWDNLMRCLTLMANRSVSANATSATSTASE